MKHKNEKVIAVIALGWLGDTVVTESLCLNIKMNYPEHKLVLIVSKPFFDLGKLMTCDEFFYYDKKNEHRGIAGIFKLKETLKNIGTIEFSFLTHTHERSVLLAKLIGSKKLISLPIKQWNPLNLCINKTPHRKKESSFHKYMGQSFSDLLKLTGCKNPSLETDLRVPHEEKEITIEKFKDIVPFGDDYIVISSTSKQICNDWDTGEIEKFIEVVNKPVVFAGTGRAKEAAEKMKMNKKVSFIDITNKTSIMDLAVIIAEAFCTISVDTGTMHLSYLLNKPTICLFNQPAMIPRWYPAHLDNVKILVGHKYLNKKTKDIVKLKEINHKDVLNLLDSI